jgi:hypothetical protein
MRGARELAAKFGALPKIVEDELRKALEQGAREAVSVIESLAPPPLKGRTKWVWGPAPKSSRGIVSVGQAESRLQISVYVEDPATDAQDARSHWFEFGTGERVQKTTGRATGRMPATPFFYPGWRLTRKKARARLARALSRGIKKAGLA